MRSLPAFFIFLFTSFNVHAHFDDYTEKPFNVGAGIYKSVISVDEPFSEDHELSGYAFSVGYAITDQFALRATFFSLEHDDFSNIDSNGYDLLGYLGTGLATQGFKAYIGAGIFSDKWEVDRVSKTFDGLQLNGGIGYNWSSVSLDLIIGIRDADDYEDFFNVSATAVTSTLLLSARF